MTSSKLLLALYYNSTYSKNCPVAFSHDRFLEDTETFSFVSMVLYCVFFPVHVFVFYCILFKSPRIMNSFKMELLSFHIFASFCDHVLNSMVVGYIFFPKFCGRPLGWLTYFDAPGIVYGYLGQIGVSFLATSIVILFECRYRAIVRNRFVMDSKYTRGIYILANYVYAMAFLIPCFIKWPQDQQGEKLRILQTMPCPTPMFFSDLVFVAIDDTTTITVFYYSTIFFFVIFFQVNFYACATCYYMFFSVNIQLSERTRKLQKRIFFSLCIQVSIPTLTLFVPVACLGYVMQINLYDQVLNNVLYLAFGSHGIVSSVCTLLVYESYRRVVFCVKEKAPTTLSRFSVGFTVPVTVKVH